MKKHFTPILAILLSLCFQSEAQVIATFEEFKLNPGEHLNNAAPDAGFKSGSIELPNFYDEQFDFWSGWAISADTNRTTPGFLNQYSSITGGGAIGTSTYAVGYVYDPEFIRLQSNALGKPMIGMYVTNSTYAYYSIKDGDAFSKKFGGESGTDPDFFLLTIKKYQGGVLADDSIDVYLADYRAPDSHKDYILDEWRYVDLSSLGEVDSLVLQLRSSDVGTFGMNTPAYICIDQVSTDNLLAASALQADISTIQFAPNPVLETLYFNLSRKGNVSITSLHGITVWKNDLESGSTQIRVADWANGIYIISVDGKIAGRFAKE